MSSINWSDEKLIHRLIHNRTTRSYWDKIRLLRQRPSVALFNRCVALTSSEQKKLRLIGIHILAQLGWGKRPFLIETQELFFNLLSTEKDPDMLESILISIGHNNEGLSKAQIKTLCALDQHIETCVRDGLVSALGFMNDEQAIKSLIKLSSDKSGEIRNWSTFYLGQGERNNKTVREALWKRVNDRHEDTRIEAIWGLAKRKEEGVHALIMRELTKSLSYGSRLFKAIAETKDKSFLPLMYAELELVKLGPNLYPEWQYALECCIEELEEL